MKLKTVNLSCIQSICRMNGGLAVSAEGQSDSLTLLWKKDLDVSMQTYSKHHIDSLVRMENNSNMRFTEFYGHANPNMRNSSWEMLRKAGNSVQEDWVVEGDFNIILNNDDKECGRKKAQADMQDFKDVMDKLALVDIKTNRGWFTWVNNREGKNLVKERLDRYMVSINAIKNLPFMETNVVR
ncbi:hypothetical protein GOBAR_AA04535 [Gossypium barbadense]|uniref:Endonuclease/exonuclease/phosphatase domain-containing protein n=1 Tax=Gossypium barbadense TaxID=3634 RepID=A0A2P5YKE8_GOSBA|nr:hypothetical protein GOBAR_AA04535 [Gossypium barbadense]